MFKFLDPYKLKELKKLLQGKEHLPIVILTGAGISAESGLPTFRGNGGLWNGHRVEDVCRPEAFEANPEMVNEFYNQRRNDLLDEKIKPNAAHEALVRLEKELGEVYIITQNVDNLHERAGSLNLIHIHGELLRHKCHDCKHSFASVEEIKPYSICPLCLKSGVLRPDVVFFKEQPYDTLRALQLVNEAKIFICIGTSGNVYPAASYVVNAHRHGAVCIEVNPQKTPNNRFFDLHIEHSATKAVVALVDELIKLKKS